MELSNIQRTGDGKLPAFAWPGGYPILYLDRENSSLCADCATKSLDDPSEVPQFKPVAYAIHYEGSDVSCDQCGKLTASAYGDTQDNAG